MSSARERREHAPAQPGTPDEPPSWRTLAAVPVVGVVTLLAAVVATHAAGVPLRDTDDVPVAYVVLVGLSAFVLVALDIAVRAARRSGTRRPPRAVMRAVQRERWGWHRSVAVVMTFVSVYVCFFAYSNIKSVVPLLRPGDLFDRELADVDRALFGGHDPAALLHSLLGTGPQTQVLSAAYLLFIVGVPLSLGYAMVFHRSLRGGTYFATALSINWSLGAVTYLLLPSLGPLYATPADFAHLPFSASTHLQGVLMHQRHLLLHDPAVGGTYQAIAAFASLHASMTFTAAVSGHLLGVARRVRIALWVMFAVTLVDTIYLGWHYAVDDIAGVGVAVAALGLARVLTGVDLRSARRRSAPTPAPTSTPA